MYLLKKDTLSRVRNDKKGIDELLSEGYELLGECNEKYEITNPNPTFGEKKTKKAK
jgi:hypothetical protein